MALPLGRCDRLSHLLWSAHASIRVRLQGVRQGVRTARSRQRDAGVPILP